jgi:repressor LexA
MYPEYRDGDVIVLRKQETCETGQDCAVMVNGDDATFKRVKWSPRGVMLQAINPDYESYIFTHAEWAKKNGRILGVVVQLRRNI